MNEATELTRATFNVMRGCLIATIQADLDRAAMEVLRRDLLDLLDRSRVRRVILDCSGIEVLDAEDYEGLRRTISMTALMGTEAVVAGLRPGVVSALIDLDVDLSGLQTVLSLDDAFRLIEGAEQTVGGGAAGDGEEEPDGPR